MRPPRDTAPALGTRGRRIDQEDGLPADHSTLGLFGLVPMDNAGLARVINEKHDAAQRDARSAIRHAILAGALLRKVKAKIDHGQWLTWISTNCKFSARTATGYMRLSQLDPAKQQRVADFSLREALSEIADSTPRQVKRANNEKRQIPGSSGAVDRPHGDDARQRDHRVDDDDNPETARALAAKRELAALLLAWEDASTDAREQFVAIKGREIGGALPHQRRGAA